MVYSFKEYKPIFDTPAKRQQELAVARKIMDLLNKNKYDDLNEFMNRNQTYQDFLKKNNMETVVKHFGNSLREDDFKRIIDNLTKLTNKKQDFEKENIKTTNIDDKEYVSLKGKDKTYFVDNSNTGKKIVEQMKDLQPTQQDFQTSDTKQNTENMFKELERNKKEGFNLRYLHEINYLTLNREEQILFQVANEYQKNISGVIRVDLEKEIIVDEDDNIMRIEIENGQYLIKKDDDGIEKDEAISKEKTHQKTLTLKPVDTIYS